MKAHDRFRRFAGRSKSLAFLWRPPSGSHQIVQSVLPSMTHLA